jgi:hypothetical protein
MLADYTRVSYTKPQDRLVALSGLVHNLRIQAQLGPEVQYKSGLWSIYTIEQLCWEALWNITQYTNASQVGRRSEISRYTPTWSWASITSPVRYILPRDANEILENELSRPLLVPLPEVVAFDMADVDKLGRSMTTKACTITIRGILVPATFPIEDSPISGKQAYPTGFEKHRARVQLDCMEELERLRLGEYPYLFLPIYFSTLEGVLVSGLVLRLDRNSSVVVYRRCGYFVYRKLKQPSAEIAYDAFRIDQYGRSISDTEAVMETDKCMT